MSRSGTSTSVSRSRGSGRWFAVALLAAALVAPGCAASAATGAADEPLPASTTPGTLRAGTLQTSTLRAPRAVDLHVPGDSSNAQHVSEAGVVVGVTVTGEDARVFRWQAGRTTVLEIPSTTVEARGVNERGQVLVNTYDRGLSSVLLWEPDGTVTPVSQEGVWSSATDLNDAGTVTGIIGTPEGEQRAVVWQDGQTTDLGDLGVGFVYAASINNRGQVVGSASQPDGPDRAFLWQAGVLTPLPLPAGTTGSVAWTVNERGDVLGEVSGDAAPPGGRAVVWDRGTTLRYLGDPGVLPNDLNGRGLVVGAAESTTAGVLVPAMVDRNGTTHLRSPQGTAGEARAVNDLGTAVGYVRSEAGWQAMAWVFGVPVTLGAPPGGADLTASWALDVNRRGLVAGSVTLPAGPDAVADHAVVWDLAATTKRVEEEQQQ